MNELDSLNTTIEIIESLVKSVIEQYIVILSPNSSTEAIDNAYRISGSNGNKVKVFTQSMPGLGGALREGVAISNSDYILLMASDLETNPIYVPKMIEASIKYPNTIIVTSRWLGNDSGFSDYGVIKMLLNKIFQIFLRVIFLKELSDFTFGFRLYPSESLKKVNFTHFGFPFLLESILKPILSGWDVVEIPVKWQKRKEGESSNSLGQMSKYLKTAIEIRMGLK